MRKEDGKGLIVEPPRPSRRACLARPGGLPQEQGMAQNYFAAATESFQTNLEFIEREGRRGSPEWHLANGLPATGPRAEA
jgi:hypothetical protein